MEKQLYDNSVLYLNKLCCLISERCVGSDGNRQATTYFKEIISSFGWDIISQEFSALDWNDGGAVLKAGNLNFKVLVSPYSPGCSETAQLKHVSNISELEKGDYKNRILLLSGEIAKEQLMPKNFVFYNPQEHQNIISLLEKSEVKALICATGHNSALAGGVYPFPLIEDGDFNIPSVYMTEEEGLRLLPYVGKQVFLNSTSKRIPGNGYNIIGKKGKNKNNRIVITAHIDSKKGTPGAIDNASGITVLLLLAQLLSNYSGKNQIELVAFNGEDYYAVPGQMAYIEKNKDLFNNILLNINIDGAGYKEGHSAFSFFDIPETINLSVNEILSRHPDIVEGIQWPQGDHSIFTQMGRPAIAVSSLWFIENMDSQNVTHTEKDNLDIVDYTKIIDIALAINELVREL